MKLTNRTLHAIASQAMTNYKNKAYHDVDSELHALLAGIEAFAAAYEHATGTSLNLQLDQRPPYTPVDALE